MTPLVTLENIYLSYGLMPLLDHIKLQIFAKERIALIGGNGEGKSSLLKIIEGSLSPDVGKVIYASHLSIARLSQTLPHELQQTVFEFVAEGLSLTGQYLAEYHRLTQSLTEKNSEKSLARMDELQQKIDDLKGWDVEKQILSMLSRLALNPSDQVKSLSGGWQRRAALARSLIGSPDLLLLDEPTNHLDITGIEWLEKELLNAGKTLVFITHDRAFLQQIATRIIELDRGQLTSFPGNYQEYLRRKEEMLHAENKENAEFDKRLAKEEQWIRQGIKARRTRNEGRVRALEAMRLKRSKRREQQERASFSMNEAEKSGDLVIEVNHIHHAFDDLPIINNFSTRIMRGDRVALVGPNGIGKSTLLSIFLGKLKPQSGTVTLGTKLQIAYFDQMRSALDLDKTVLENVAGGREFIDINGRKMHIMSYLNTFLFTPVRAQTPVKALSGGECNRLLLARLFSQPANLLVMDEPTNDLDIQTLELLEDILADFQGTLLLISHDRAFLDNVVISTLVFEGEGKITEYVGGYHAILRKAPAQKLSPKKPKPEREKAPSKSKLSYKEQRELDELPEKIEQLELDIKTLQETILTPSFYKDDPVRINQTLGQLKQKEDELEKAYARWQTLAS